MTSPTVIAFTSIGFLFLTATMPAGAQTAAPAGGPVDTGAQDTAAISDFSGIWAHLMYIPLPGRGRTAPGEETQNHFCCVYLDA
jgi:hypothetical protein